MTSRTDPFGDIEELLDMVMGDVGQSAGLPVDVADTGDEYVVTADLPGYDRDDIDVRLPDPTTLSIAASRDTETIESADRYVNRERHSQSVSRQVGLPEPVEETETSATYENGVLTVTLPKQSGSGDETQIDVE